MRRYILFALAVGLVVGMLALGGCAADPQAEQRERLDDAIHDVEIALGRYYTVDPQGPASALETVTERVASAWEGAREEAIGLDDIETAAAQEALDDLVQATEGLADDLTAREGLAALEPYIEEFDHAVDEIHDALDAH